MWLEFRRCALPIYIDFHQPRCLFHSCAGESCCARELRTSHALSWRLSILFGQDPCKLGAGGADLACRRRPYITHVASCFRWVLSIRRHESPFLIPCPVPQRSEAPRSRATAGALAGTEGAATASPRTRKGNTATRSAPG